MNTSKTLTEKRHLFKTAKALIGCAKFGKGDIVAVKYYCQNQEGIHYYLASKTGRLVEAVAYPEHHLTNFVL